MLRPHFSAPGSQAGRQAAAKHPDRPPAASGVEEEEEEEEEEMDHHVAVLDKFFTATEEGELVRGPVSASGAGAGAGAGAGTGTAAAESAGGGWHAKAKDVRLVRGNVIRGELEASQTAQTGKRPFWTRSNAQRNMALCGAFRIPN